MPVRIEIASVQRPLEPVEGDVALTGVGGRGWERWHKQLVE